MKMAGLLGFEPRIHGIKTRCLTAWLQPNKMVDGGRFELPNPEGADLQSAAFSHFATPPFLSKWWLETESNRRHKDFQSFALPTELSSLIYMAIRTGLEPATSSVTGWHSNQ